MLNCTDLVDDLDTQARKHVHLAIIAEAQPVAEMHIDLALFSKTQARIVENLCEDP